MSRNSQITNIPAVEVTSLGCAKNFVDTEIATASLLTSGFQLTGDEVEANVKFINTCAFLKSARTELEEVLAKAKAWKKRKKGRKIVVTGCIVLWDKDGSFLRKHPEIDIWYSPHILEKMGADLTDAFQRESAGTLNFTGNTHQWIYNCNTPRVQLTPPHYAYLKVSDGCDNRCTYCKIPDIRGNLISRTTEDVVKEAQNLLDCGVKELIVIAQDTAAFGRDVDGKPKLAELLDKLDKLNGIYILRVMYLHPASIDDKLLAALKRNKHLVKCIEMPIQHISDHILMAMHRKIGGKETRAVVKKLQNAGFLLRTTFMVGFPGETVEDFEELLAYVKETKFTRLGTFAFSPEEGTPAYTMPNAIPRDVAEKRLDQLMRTQQGISLSLNQSLIGKTVDVILDEMLPGQKARGRMFTDAPEIDNTVIVRKISKSKYAPGDFIRMTVEAASEYEIFGGCIAPDIVPALASPAGTMGRMSRNKPDKMSDEK